jgi:hypothetical protein
MMHESDNQQQQMADTNLLNEVPLNRIDHYKSSNKTDNTNI